MRGILASVVLCLGALSAAAEVAVAEVAVAPVRPVARPVADTRVPLRPEPRPDVRAPEVARATVLPMLVAPAIASAEDVRPAARPGVIALKLHASPRPRMRPASGPERITPAAIVRSAPVPEATTGARARKVCGDPAIIGRKIPPIAARLKGCGLEDGVSVISVAGVALTQPVSVDCATAGALKDWVERGVKPAVGRKGGGVAAMQIAASYSCRPRNNQKGAKISEHGRGRAIDVSAVILVDGSAITVLKGWGTKAEGATLASMHKAACGPFSTVLGPGADRHHADHFHLDTAPGRGPYCR